MKAMISCVLACLLLLSTFGAAAAETMVSIDDIEFDEPDRHDFNAEYIELLHEPLWWESDGAFIIELTALDANLGTSHDGGYVKPLRDLWFKLHDETEWQQLEQYTQTVYAGDGGGSGTLYLDWRVALDWEADRPGDYEATLVFTVSGT